jgi:hypothetical protein
MHGNLEQNEVLAFIKCKHMEHVAQKQLIDPRAHRVPTTQRWNKIVKDFQNLLCAKEIFFWKVSKDKWNGLNSNFKKLTNYHKGTKHNMSFWEMTMEECKKNQ